VNFATDPEGFSPYKRDEKLARMWAKPGTPGLEHRIGGLEKDALTGSVSHDPDNHQIMVETREAKIMGIRESIPTPAINGPDTGDVLAVSWGSTFGATRAAIERMQKEGVAAAHVHLRHVWPLPHGLDKIFAGYKRIFVPELNLGQLARILTSEYPQFKFETYYKVKGKPFQAFELKAHFEKKMEEQS
jgi:2-oxoglutarate/2-oxoacid ferredoxin oxidoreductase subunit alpha